MSCLAPNRDAAARDTLIKYVEARDGGHHSARRLEEKALVANEDIALSAARRRSSSVPLDEREQAARIGLLKAMRSWRSDGGANLRTWAALPMLEAMADAELEQNPVVIPRTQLRRRRSALEALASFRAEGVEPTMAEIADRCGLTEGVVTRLLAAPAERDGEASLATASALISTWSETSLDLDRAIESAMQRDARGTEVLLESVVLGKTFTEIADGHDRSRQLMSRRATEGAAALRNYSLERRAIVVRRAQLAELERAPVLTEPTPIFARLSDAFADAEISERLERMGSPDTTRQLDIFATVEPVSSEPAPIVVLPFKRARPWPTVSAPPRPRLPHVPALARPSAVWHQGATRGHADASRSTSIGSPASGTGLGRGPPRRTDNLMSIQV